MSVPQNQNQWRLLQKTALRCGLGCLASLDESEKYITARLLLAAAKTTDILIADAVRSTFHCSPGMPRTIKICDNAVSAGFASSVKSIETSITGNTIAAEAIY